MSEQEILLALNIIAYSGTWRENSYRGKKIKNIIDEFKKPDTVPTEDWNKIVNAVKKNKEFLDLTIKKVESVENKQLNILFTDNQNRALVIFKGTDKYEWHDNAAGGQWDVAETEQQRNANDFITNNCKEYEKVIVSGHSKGGNKAQYVAILNDLVDQAYSFDGQGMGYNFILKNKKLINENADKITMYNYSSDFVNPLFINLGIKKVNFVQSDTTILDFLFEGDFKNLALFHSPDKMLDFTHNPLKMKSVDGIKQDSTALMINGLTEYMMLHLNQDDWTYFSNMMVHMFENGDCSGEFDINDMPNDFVGHILNEGCTYLTEKMGFSTLEASTFLTMLLIKGLGDIILTNNPNLKKFFDTASIHAFKTKINNMMVQTTGNDIVRNYTRTMQDSFEKLVKESQDDEPIYEFWNWDVWTKVSDSFKGGYTLEEAGNDLNTYQKHMIDMEDITLKETRRIFTDIYKADKEFADLIKDITLLIEKTNKDIKDNLLNKINLS